MNWNFRANKHLLGNFDCRFSRKDYFNLLEIVLILVPLLLCLKHFHSVSHFNLIKGCESSSTTGPQSCLCYWLTVLVVVVHQVVSRRQNEALWWMWGFKPCRRAGSRVCSLQLLQKQPAAQPVASQPSAPACTVRFIIYILHQHQRLVSKSPVGFRDCTAKHLLLTDPSNIHQSSLD